MDVNATVLEYHQKLVDKHAVWLAREAERGQDPICVSYYMVYMF